MTRPQKNMRMQLEVALEISAGRGDWGILVRVARIDARKIIVGYVNIVLYYRGELKNKIKERKIVVKKFSSYFHCERRY